MLSILLFLCPWKDQSKWPNCRCGWNQSGWCHTKFCCNCSQKYQRESQVIFGFKKSLEKTCLSGMQIILSDDITTCSIMGQKSSQERPRHCWITSPMKKWEKYKKEKWIYKNFPQVFWGGAWKSYPERCHQYLRWYWVLVFVLLVVDSYCRGCYKRVTSC